MSQRTYIRSFVCLSTFAAFILSACAHNTTVEFYDPFEKTNRKTHELNKRIDQWLLRPAGKAYGAAFNEVDDEIINSFATNLSEPSTAANYFLQGRLEKASQSILRFALNTTLGMGGLNEVASDFGLQADETDFGETLHVWGIGEGAYIELPFYGGSTARDTVGILVDFTLDPMDQILPKKYKTHTVGVKLVELAGDRDQYGDVIDSVLYETEDSYASQRLYYLQNRRFQLGGNEISDDELENPYDDLE